MFVNQLLHLVSKYWLVEKDMINMNDNTNDKMYQHIGTVKQELAEI